MFIFELENFLKMQTLIYNQNTNQQCGFENTI
jgi:hypothetical protein